MRNLFSRQCQPTNGSSCLTTQQYYFLSRDYRHLKEIADYNVDPNVKKHYLDEANKIKNQTLINAPVDRRLIKLFKNSSS